MTNAHACVKMALNMSVADLCHLNAATETGAAFSVPRSALGECDVKPGDPISFAMPDGSLVTEVMTSSTWTSGSPAIYAELTWWQRVLRRLTPVHRRKPIPIVRPATLPSVTMKFGESGEFNADRQRAQMAAMVKMAETLTTCNNLPPGSSVLDIGTGAVVHTPGRWAGAGQ